MIKKATDPTVEEDVILKTGFDIKLHCAAEYWDDDGNPDLKEFEDHVAEVIEKYLGRIQKDLNKHKLNPNNKHKFESSLNNFEVLGHSNSKHT